MYGALVSVIALIVLVNFFFWFRWYKKNRRTVKRSVPVDVEAALREREIQRRIDREQNAAVEYIEKRAKTWELYEQVRRQAEAAEHAKPDECD